MIRADVKPALMAAIEGEFAKCPKNPAHVAARTSRADAQKRGAARAAPANPGGGAANGKTPQLLHGLHSTLPAAPLKTHDTGFKADI